MDKLEDHRTENLAEVFDKATTYVRTIAGNLRSEQLLYLYGRFKQVRVVTVDRIWAIIGDANASCSCSFSNFQTAALWDPHSTQKSLKWSRHRTDPVSNVWKGYVQMTGALLYAVNWKLTTPLLQRGESYRRRVGACRSGKSLTTTSLLRKRGLGADIRLGRTCQFVVIAEPGGTIFAGKRRPMRCSETRILWLSGKTEMVRLAFGRFLSELRLKFFCLFCHFLADICFPGRLGRNWVLSPKKTPWKNTSMSCPTSNLNGKKR